jgi:hypothetical protein
MVVVVLAAQLAVLLSAPSYFSFYRDYAAAAAALVLAAAAHHRFRNRKARYELVLVGGCVALAGAATGAMLAHRDTAVTPFPGGPLAAGVRSSRCVMADSPMALIELNALSRGFAHGCPNWVDVTGRTYDVDASTGSRSTPRVDNTRWQRDLRRYLLSGDAVILIRSGTGAAPSTKDAVSGHPVLRTSDGYTIYRTGPSSHLAGG